MERFRVVTFDTKGNVMSKGTFVKNRAFEKADQKWM